MNPNSFDKETKDANANPETPIQGTEPVTPDEKPATEGVPTVDYQKKFAESSKEALRLYEENKKLQDELMVKATIQTADNLYPGFEQLDKDAQENLMTFANGIRKRTFEDFSNDPAIKFSKNLYNENKWESAFTQVVDKFPELKSSKEDFKKKYFKADVIVPDNINSIMEDVAKIHLFDKAKDLGAQEEKAKANRVELERTNGGDKTPQVSRTLEDWNRMAQENPVKFAQMSKDFHSDMNSGKI